MRKTPVYSAGVHSSTRCTRARDGIYPLLEPPSEPVSTVARKIYAKPAFEVDEALLLRRRFEQLSHAWNEATTYSSSTTEISMHPAYQQLIGMGRAVLPFIFAELRKRPAHWFWALKSITGDDPVRHADRGNLFKMTGAWLEWADRHGYAPAP